MKNSYSLLVSVSFVAAMVSQPAIAQDLSTDTNDTVKLSHGLDEIVVTAQKRSENLQKVPISIAVVGADQLNNAGVQGTQGLAAVLPGLQVLNIGGNVTPRVRGVGSGFAAAGLESPVATYVDGVYIANPADVNMDLFDIEQVSLIKGPQGTLFGRNATGGVLQVTTRDPEYDFKARARLGYDEYETLRADMFVTGGISEKVSTSVAASYINQGQGWGSNIFTGKYTHKTDHSISVRGKVRAELGEMTTLRVSADYSDRQGPMAMNFRPFPGYGTAYPAPQPNRLWDINNAVDSKVDYRGVGASITVDQEIGDLTLTMISGYRDSRNFFHLGPAATTTPLLDIVSTDKADQFTQEFQLSSSDLGRLAWQTGIYYFGSEAERDQILDFSPEFSANLAQQITGNPAEGPAIFPFVQQIVIGTQRVDSVAAYAQATYKITDHTRFTAGFRYTWQWTNFSGDDVYVLPGGLPVVDTSVQNVKGSFKKPTWRLALDHDFTPDITGFISYNRGVKSGGFNISTPSNPAYLPEQLDAYEAGVKSEFFGRNVRLNMSTFYYDYKNIQVPAFATVLIINNGASAELYGADVELLAQVTDNLTLNASANILHAEFRSFPAATYTTPLANGQPSLGFPADASGNSVPYSPNFTYTIGATYTVPSPNGEFTININDNYNSGFYSEADNLLKQRSYHFLNASIGWQSLDEAYSARIYVNNILDKAVVSQFSTVAPNSYIGDYSNPPRIFGGSVEWRF